jgi:hypothetical protein
MLLILVSVVLVNVAYPSTEPGRPREFNTCRNIPTPLLDRWEKIGSSISSLEFRNALVEGRGAKALTV